MATKKSKNWYSKKYKSEDLAHGPAKLLGALVLVVVAAYLVTTYAAPGGKGGGGGGKTTSGTSTITLNSVSPDSNGDGLPNYGDSVDFTIATTATTQPWVNVNCSQNGTLVMQSWRGYFSGSLDTTRFFGLGSPAWQSGAADCTANLDMYTKHGYTNLASTTFHVNP